jgi:predicted small secreted protein
MVAILLVAVSLTLSGCEEETATGTIEDYEAVATSAEEAPWIGVRLDDGRYIRASITQAQADENGISAETVAEGGQQVEVLMHWKLSLGDMTYWEFVRVVEADEE